MFIGRVPVGVIYLFDGLYMGDTWRLMQGTDGQVIQGYKPGAARGGLKSLIGAYIRDREIRWRLRKQRANTPGTS